MVILTAGFGGENGRDPLRPSTQALRDRGGNRPDSPTRGTNRPGQRVNAPDLTYPGRSPAQEGPGRRLSDFYATSDRNPFNRGSTAHSQRFPWESSDYGSPQSRIIAAMGGSTDILSRQRQASQDLLQQWALDVLNTGKQFVGIQDPMAWAQNLQAPWLGGDIAFGGRGMRYQLPEYETWRIAAELDAMTDDELADFREKAKAAGLYDDSSFVPSNVGRSPEDITVMAKLMARANTTAHTSWSTVLDELVANPSIELDGTGTSGQDTGPTTQRNIIYQKTSQDAGRSLLRQLMRDLIGREPTDSEVSEYVAALNREEQRRPEIVETVTEMGDNENASIVTQTVEQNAPVPQEYLRGQVEEGNEEEQFTYQAQGYFDRLMEII